MANVGLTSMGLERIQCSQKLHKSSIPSVKFSGVVESDLDKDSRRMGVRKNTREPVLERERLRSSRKKSLKRGTSRRRKSRDMQKGRSSISELPSDAVVIDLRDSAQERLPAVVFEEVDNLDVGLMHGRFGGCGRRHERFYQKEPY